MGVWAWAAPGASSGGDPVFESFDGADLASPSLYFAGFDGPAGTPTGSTMVWTEAAPVALQSSAFASPSVYCAAGDHHLRAVGTASDDEDWASFLAVAIPFGGNDGDFVAGRSPGAFDIEADLTLGVAGFVWPVFGFLFDEGPVTMTLDTFEWTHPAAPSGGGIANGWQMI